MSRRWRFFRRAPPVRAERGFSKFEFALAAALFAALLGIAANRMRFYQQNAESVAAKQLVATLRGALAIKTAHLAAAREGAGIAALIDENPIGWLYENPHNYLGEYYSPDAQTLPRGNWYFDRRDKTLVYLSSERESFVPHSLILLKFKVKYFHRPTLPAASPPSASIENAVLVQVFDEPGVGAQ